MSRSGTKARSPRRTVPVHERLARCDLVRWAGEHVARAGRRDALVGRVETLHVALDGCSIAARVRGSRSQPHSLSVRIDGAGLECRCTCSRGAAGPCRHVVAALETLRFPRPALDTSRARRPRRSGGSRSGRGRIVQPAATSPGFVILGGAERILTRDERVAVARDEELARLRQRARRRWMRIRERPDDGGPPSYEARGRSGPPRTVVLRGPQLELAGCDCDAYQELELGTCVHIERVRTWRRRQRKKDRRKASPATLGVWCGSREWIVEAPDPLREIRVDEPADCRTAQLERYFEADGWLRPSPGPARPSAWARAAVRAARRSAARRRLTWDLDPRVSTRIASAAAAEARSAKGHALDRRQPIWRDTVGRLGFRLHPYQEEGVLFLARAGRAFLADDMGLGKTVQAIAAALLLRRRAAPRALVVCPASLKHQWSREIHKACDERAVVLDGSRASRQAAYAAWRRGFLIINYELVLRDLESIRDASPDVVILDEAQRIKNWDTETARSVKRLDSPHAFILTGTPLENRLLELHSLVEFLNPRALGPRWRLMAHHAVTERRGRIIAYEALDILRNRLRGFFLRREREEVAHQLPERTDNTFWTDMTPAQRRPYGKYAATAAAILARGRAIGPPEVRALLRALTGMRILCNAYAQHAWDRYAGRVTSGRPASRRDLRALHSPKLDEFARVLEDLLDESDRKIVVFSQWERMLRLAHFAVRGLLDSRQLRAELFHGALDSRSRRSMLDAFREDPELHVLFSTDAGGLGLNLQEAASVVLHLEVPWNPAVLEQRISRVHRLGQRHAVQVLHFVTRGAIEERIRQVLEGKRALFRGLLVEQVDRLVLDGEGQSTFFEGVREIFDADGTVAG